MLPGGNTLLRHSWLGQRLEIRAVAFLVAADYAADGPPLQELATALRRLIYLCQDETFKEKSILVF